MRFGSGNILKSAVAVLAIALGMLASDAVAEVLVFKWKVKGSEYATAFDADNSVLWSVKENGFIVVDYNIDSEVFSEEMIVRYWKSPADKLKYYRADEFLFGIGDFEFFEVEKGAKVQEYMSVSAFWGGMLGDYYSGKTKLVKAGTVGIDRDFVMGNSMKGYSSWNKLYQDGSTAEGGGKVSMKFDKKWTKYANENSLDVDQTVTEIVGAVKAKKYDNLGPEWVINTPAEGEVDITGGTIDGTVIGGEDPADGTFINLIVGKDDKNGTITVHSGDTGFDAVIKNSPDMTEDTVLILPPDNGRDGQVLTTDGAGNLSWTDKGGGHEARAGNIGTEGEGVYDSKLGDELRFRNVAPGSEKVTVTLNGANIEVDVDTAKIDPATLMINPLDRANQTGTQSAATINDFQETVLENPNVHLDNTSAIIAPAATDDSSMGYSKGSVWINTATQKVYTCANASLGAATWLESSMTPGEYLKSVNNLSDLADTAAARTNLGLGNVRNTLNNYNATTPPTANDDSTKGYSSGSVWIDTVGGVAYTCSNAAAGAATWLESSVDPNEFLRAANNLSDLTDTAAARNNIGLGNVRNTLNNYDAAAPPAVDDDSTMGYSKGSVWIDTAANKAYTCADATPGAAVWLESSLDPGQFLQAANNLSDLTDTATARNNLGLGYVGNILNNYSANRPPAADDDVNDDYSVGSTWADVSGDGKVLYICIDNSDNAAVWQVVTSGLTAGEKTTGGFWANDNVSAWH